MDHMKSLTTDAMARMSGPKRVVRDANGDVGRCRGGAVVPSATEHQGGRDGCLSVQSVQMLNGTASATTWQQRRRSRHPARAGDSPTSRAETFWREQALVLTLGSNTMIQGSHRHRGGRAGMGGHRHPGQRQRFRRDDLASPPPTATQRAMAIRVAEWTGARLRRHRCAGNFGNGGGSGSRLTIGGADQCRGVYTGVVTVDSSTANTSIVTNATETVFATSARPGQARFRTTRGSGYGPGPAGTFVPGSTGPGDFAPEGCRIKAAAGGISRKPQNVLLLLQGHRRAVIVSGQPPGHAFSRALPLARFRFPAIQAGCLILAGWLLVQLRIPRCRRSTGACR